MLLPTRPCPFPAPAPLSSTVTGPPSKPRQSRSREAATFFTRKVQTKQTNTPQQTQQTEQNKTNKTDRQTGQDEETLGGLGPQDPPLSQDSSAYAEGSLQGGSWADSAAPARPRKRRTNKTTTNGRTDRRTDGQTNKPQHEHLGAARACNSRGSVARGG